MIASITETLVQPHAAIGSRARATLDRAVEELRLRRAAWLAVSPRARIELIDTATRLVPKIVRFEADPSLWRLAGILPLAMWG